MMRLWGLLTEVRTVVEVAIFAVATWLVAVVAHAGAEATAVAAMAAAHVMRVRVRVSMVFSLEM
jgi:hypothetical protein